MVTGRKNWKNWGQGAADKAVNLGRCKSFHRKLPDNGRLVYALII